MFLPFFCFRTTCTIKSKAAMSTGREKGGQAACTPMAIACGSEGCRARSKATVGGGERKRRIKNSTPGMQGVDSANLCDPGLAAIHGLMINHE